MPGSRPAPPRAWATWPWFARACAKRSHDCSHFSIGTSGCWRRRTMAWPPSWVCRRQKTIRTRSTPLPPTPMAPALSCDLPRMLGIGGAPVWHRDQQHLSGERRESSRAWPRGRLRFSLGRGSTDRTARPTARRAAARDPHRGFIAIPRGLPPGEHRIRPAARRSRARSR